MFSTPIKKQNVPGTPEALFLSSSSLYIFPAEGNDYLDQNSFGYFDTFCKWKNAAYTLVCEFFVQNHV